MNSYVRALLDSQKELVELEAQRRLLDQRIEHLKTGMRALMNMVDPGETGELLESASAALGREGFTDTIRSVLREAGMKGLQATEVRDELVRRGLPLQERVNPLASIHSVLRRLVAGGEARKAVDDKDDSVYQWIFRMTPPPATDKEVALSPGAESSFERLHAKEIFPQTRRIRPSDTSAEHAANQSFERSVSRVLPPPAGAKKK
ncbi:hypothetical protein [Granulicella sibirica]|uniref:hypothetical protein n=1 Tax=Granulicella sibirica TaxID=2479048 RepID=UPI001008D4A7|nr:hypothetical protein [Granulicella sibirica]